MTSTSIDIYVCDINKSYNQIKNNLNVVSKITDYKDKLPVTLKPKYMYSLRISVTN